MNIRAIQSSQVHKNYFIIQIETYRSTISAELILFAVSDCSFRYNTLQNIHLHYSLKLKKINEIHKSECPKLVVHLSLK